MSKGKGIKIVTNEFDNSAKKTVDVQNDFIELPHGNALTLEETYRITSAYQTNFIVLAGPSGCGKTTLVTTVYQMFQKEPMEKYHFAGSETLLGFEQRAFLTRTTSGNASSQTPKTRRGILDSILHLKLWCLKNKVFQNLLITDFSGEDYKSVIANVDLAKEEFGVIKRADHIVILIDGALISQKKYRNGVEQESLQLLKTFIDAGLLNKNVCLDILISKYDIVIERSREDPSIHCFIKNIYEKFCNKFHDQVKDLNIYNVAAMPEDKSEIQIGYGLSALIQSWVEGKDKSSIKADILQHDMSSEFNLFDIKVREKLHE